MTDLPPDDLPPPDGAPVEGLAAPSGAAPAPQFPPPSSPAVEPVFPPPAGGAIVPPAPPAGGYLPPPPSGSHLPPPPSAPVNPLPSPPGGWIDVPEPVPSMPPPPAGGFAGMPPPPPGSPGAYQTYPVGGFRPVLTYANVGKRLVGNIIDSLLTALVPVVIYGVGIATTTPKDVCTNGYTTDSLGNVTCSPPPGAVLGFALGALALYLLLVQLIVAKPISTTGQTIGMRLMNVRLVDANTGSPITIGRAWGRHIASITLSRFCCSLGYFWALFDKRNQTWHDAITTSVVVDA